MKYQVQQNLIPHRPKVTATLGAAQRRFTKVIPGLCMLNHQERLGSMGLYSLEFSRMKSGIIQTNKIISGHEMVNVEMFPLAGEL